MSLLEGDFIESERCRFRRCVEPDTPGAGEVTMWFESLCRDGPGRRQDDLLDWLAEAASLSEIRWFLEQETAAQTGFSDLVPLTLLRMPALLKRRMGSHYGNELGRGHAMRAYGRLIDGLAVDLNLERKIEQTVWECLALSNLLLGLASNRRYAYHAVGALGAVELTAPARTAAVAAALERLGLASQPPRRLAAPHTGAAADRARPWGTNLIQAVLEQDPAARQSIAEGASMYLLADARCLTRYRRALLPASASANFSLRLEHRSARIPGPFR